MAFLQTFLINRLVMGNHRIQYTELVKYANQQQLCVHTGLL